MRDRCETFTDCRTTIPLSSVKVSNLYESLLASQTWILSYTPALWFLWLFKWAKSDVWTMHVFPNPITQLYDKYEYKCIHCVCFAYWRIIHWESCFTCLPYFSILTNEPATRWYFILSLTKPNAMYILVIHRQHSKNFHKLAIEPIPRCW